MFALPQYHVISSRQREIFATLSLDFSCRQCSGSGSGSTCSEGLQDQDPDPLVRGMDPDPDPDPSIIKQK
jgi:hypothetical protein